MQIFIGWLIAWAALSFGINKYQKAKEKKSMLIMIGGGFIGAIMLLAVVAIVNDKASTPKEAPTLSEQALTPSSFYGIDVTLKQDEFVKKYSDGFEKCTTINSHKTSCQWNSDMHSQFFLANFFESNLGLIRHSSKGVEFPVILAEIEKTLNQKFTFTPVTLNMKAGDSDVDEMIKNNAITVIDYGNIPKGEKLAMGCTASIPFLGGFIKIVGTGDKTYFRNCSPEIFGKLSQSNVIYVTSEFLANGGSF